MRPTEYDRRLALLIRQIRKGKEVKQIVVANALKVDQSTYSRIEHGEIAITPGQLRIICTEIGSSASDLLALLEG